MSDMIRRQILPAVSEFATTLADRIAVKKEAGFSAGYEAKVGAKISTLSDKLQLAQEKIDNDLKKRPADSTKCMKYSRDTILKDMNKARDILSTLENKEELTQFVENGDVKPDEKRGIQVYIGDENKVDSMKDCSVVTATYEIEEGIYGKVGIIGPKRMDYERVVGTLQNMMGQLDDIFKNKKP